MRSLASVPIAENISAYLAICSEVFLAWACTMFRYLQKYRGPVKWRRNLGETVEAAWLSTGRINALYQYRQAKLWVRCGSTGQVMKEVKGVGGA